MAVNIDTVYQKVLAMANKEQRGYITPQEFNLYADQAQMDIFERYFHDIRQAETRTESDTEFSSSLDMLDEKLNVFRAYDKIIYPTTFDGVVELPTNVYRLGKVYYCTSHDYRNYTSLAGGAGVKIDIEQIKNDYSSILKTKYNELANLVDYMIEYEENEFNNKVEYTTPMAHQKKWTDKDYKYFRKMNENGKVKSITYVVNKEMGKPVKADNIPW